jgi:hypothetical protein
MPKVLEALESDESPTASPQLRPGKEPKPKAGDELESLSQTSTQASLQDVKSPTSERQRAGGGPGHSMPTFLAALGLAGAAIAIQCCTSRAVAE